MNTYWFCRCDCGKVVAVMSTSLRAGATRSCGCLQREVTARRNKARSKGGYIREGYKLVRANGREVREHRLVMERFLGRPLTPDEHVHHRNGQRADNRPENLEVWVVPSQPAGQRVDDIVAWALEVLRRYAPDRLR